MIAIIDYGLGNLRSVEKIIQRAGHTPVISSNPDVLQNADKLILPGVGHFSKGVNNLKEKKLWDTLQEEVIQKQKPILGICLGMQLMTNFSEEGNVSGLAWIDAETKHFPASDKLKIPHMGWNTLITKKNSPLAQEINETNEFYFVHSYYVACNKKEDILFETNYLLNFTSGFQKNNIYGVQFHPEKSHKAGLTLIKNFLAL